MKLNDYLPPFLRNVKEFNIINSAFDIEGDYIKSEMERYIREAFVTTAEEEGLSRMEKILSLKGGNKTVELRRFNILAELKRSREDLISLLKDFAGEIEYSFTEDFSLKVTVAARGIEYMPAIKKILEKYVPCNIALEINQMYATHAMTGKYTHIQLSSLNHSQIRERI